MAGGGHITPSEVRSTRRVASPARLASDAGIVEVVEGARHVERLPLSPIGFSGSSLERVRVWDASGREHRLILKQIHPRQDWTAYRTGDTAGREAALPLDPALDAVWQHVVNPYRAAALDTTGATVLMDDLGSAVPAPGAEPPLSRRQEDAALRTLAALHAAFWRSRALDAPWVARFAQRLNILCPAAPEEELARPAPPPVFRSARQGWEAALAALPSGVRRRLLAGPDAIAQPAAGLRETLLHGDPKPGNMAFLPDGRVAMFDWAVVGRGPATMDLGHYLAINGPYLTRSPDAVIRLYRRSLEENLGDPLPNDEWDALLGAGLLGAASVLLWTLGLALDSGAAGAKERFRWWIGALERSVPAAPP